MAFSVFVYGILESVPMLLHHKSYRRTIIIIIIKKLV